VPRNWHPPPGDAQARQPKSAASSNVICPCANRAPIVWIFPASSPLSGGNVTPPGTSAPARSLQPASAIIIAGNPLSQVATPRTPRRCGKDRINRRKTVAASFRYGSASIIPRVPWVLPSHGSLTNPANGVAPAARMRPAAASASSPTSQWPVWYPSATGVPSGFRIPP
jgi:hypothetical protein